jgi:hypothetical protein
LAELRVPSIVAASHHDYVLHPSLIDAALQAAWINLGVESSHFVSRPFVPFAVESLRIASGCTSEMAAWVRYSDSDRDGETRVLDIDVCDTHGNVCVEIRGCAGRILDGETRSTHHDASTGRNSDETTLVEADREFDSVFYSRLVAAVANRELSVDEAVELG